MIESLHRQGTSVSVSVSVSMSNVHGVVGKKVINLLRLRSFPILDQLRLEECLLRASRENWCIVNDGTQPPAIVMGISG